MNILLVCPAHVATGGTESIHRLAYEFNKIKDVSAKILYVNVKNNTPIPKEYAHYECEYVLDLPTGYKDVIIFPEIFANNVCFPAYKDCIKAILWLGVDSYFPWSGGNNLGAFLKENVFHIVQSSYAADFLQKLGVKRSYYSPDVLNDIYYEDYEENFRNDTVVFYYNRASSYTKKVIESLHNRGINTLEIKGLTQEGVRDVLRKSKVYIDFGEFPGRDRMPREAVMCGCNIVLGKAGSSNFYNDFSIPDLYKFDRKDGNIFVAVSFIKQMLDDYEHYKGDFDTFRARIRNDRSLLSKSCNDLVDVFKGAKHEV